MIIFCRITAGPDGHVGQSLRRLLCFAEEKSDSHTPRATAFPGSGWQIIKFERTNIVNNGTILPVNRVVIEKNSLKQFVYYWFDESGRKVANEYLAKWYFHLDAVLINRTDGSLVRLVTQIRGRRNRTRCRSASDKRSSTMFYRHCQIFCHRSLRPMCNTALRA